MKTIQLSDEEARLVERAIVYAIDHDEELSDDSAVDLLDGVIEKLDNP
jgi:hypothetical protein